MKWYRKVIMHYADFNGRASRSEYWYFVLFNIIFSIAAAIVDNILGTEELIYGLYCLFAILPSIAVGARRLHDIGKSGWFQLIIFIPLVGLIWLIILLATDSQPGSNEYGPNPAVEAV